MNQPFLIKSCSVWRPLFGPLEDAPLAMCDYRSTSPERDFLAADLLFPHYHGEQFLCKHHPDHRWYFLSKQMTNEFTLMKCFDSQEQGTARCMFFLLLIHLQNIDHWVWLTLQVYLIRHLRIHVLHRLHDRARALSSDVWFFTPSKRSCEDLEATEIISLQQTPWSYPCSFNSREF